jgi:uncharacterized protein (DUF488 family)
VGLRDAAFRGYADHMATPEFRAALDELLALGARERPAVMCAEAVPWRCHRWLLSDAIVARGETVEHIIGPGPRRAHRLNDMAVEQDGRVSYPGQSVLPLDERQG